MFATRVRRPSLVVAVALLATACGSPDEPAESVDLAPWSLRVDAVLAEVGDIPSAQLAVVESARASGGVSFEDYSAAVNATIGCIRDAGVTVDGPLDEGHASGLVLLGYGVPANDPAAEAVESGCYSQHLHVVDILYQSSPAARALQGEFLEEWREPLVACLEDNGIQVANPQDAQAVVAQAGEVAFETNDAIDCRQEVGLADAPPDQ